MQYALVSIQDRLNMHNSYNLYLCLCLLSAKMAYPLNEWPQNQEESPWRMVSHLYVSTCLPVGTSLPTHIILIYYAFGSLAIGTCLCKHHGRLLLLYSHTDYTIKRMWSIWANQGQHVNFLISDPWEQAFLVLHVFTDHCLLQVSTQHNIIVYILVRSP